MICFFYFEYKGSDKRAESNKQKLFDVIIGKTNQTLSELRKRVEEMKGERDAAYLRSKILEEIDELIKDGQ